ncbi:MAG TPA: [FeFe] hydrogenase H-cluster radical SAM maturase HydE [Ignavibacteriaceae bacterium]|nr:[FeFe] hydrogenase H-cluster radical SAM maturase HydE [Ignavibacteriaceae bacterium]
MILKSILKKDNLDKFEISFLLSLSDKKDIDLLYQRADEVRKKYVGDDVYLRGIIEFSNYCEQDCLYCGLRKSNDGLERYRMSLDNILLTAGNIVKSGIKTIVLQSGEDFLFSKSDITNIIKSIKEKYDVAITLSLGERSREEYFEWCEAGADRYLLKHETANPKLYSMYHQGQNLADRITHLNYLREAGFQIGSGNLVGMPHQTNDDVADDILLCKELDVDMCSISPFISSPSTPYKKKSNCSVEYVLKTMAVARIVLKNSHMPATTALATLDIEGREKGLQVGANVIMPNFTPNPYRKNYLIYPDKKCLTDDPMNCAGCLSIMVQSLGRRIGVDKGHSLKKDFISI